MRLDAIPLAWKRRITDGGLTLAATVALMLPALYNGFPLVFHDTGAYLARAFQSQLEPGRGPFYGFLIAASGGYVSLWPVIVLQAGATVWLIALTLRLHGVAGRRALLLAVFLLSALTGAAWGTATLMPDAFSPLVVLGWYLLAFGANRLARTELVGIAALLLLAALVHVTHLALLLGLALCPGIPLLIRHKMHRAGVLLAAGLPLAALLVIPLINGLVSDRFGFTPGGESFVFGRLVQSGLIERYLDEHCPDGTIRLCNYRGSLPETGDSWLWDVDSPFYSLGGWEGYAGEMRRLTTASLADHPWLHLRSAALATTEQLVRVGVGEDIDSPTWHTDAEIGARLPQLLPDFLGARQHDGQLGRLTSLLNKLYVPATLAALAALSALLLVTLWRGHGRGLPATVALALLGNAVLCGVFSGPHDRYQSRIAWLAGLTVIVGIDEARRRVKGSAQPGEK